MARKSPLVIGLDVGTYKIGVIVAEVAEGGIEVVGIGTAASRGLRKGVVVNIEKTVEAIRRAVEEAELMAACEIRSVIAGSAGSHIKGFNSHGVVAVRNREVAPGDVDRVVDAARAVALPTDQEVLHVLPQEFIVDDQDGIREPVGMAGVRLEARVHIVTGAVSAGQNLIKCCNRAGLHVRDLLAGPLAAAEAGLTPAERELGVAPIALGGATIDVVVYQAGAIRHTAVLPVGGGHVTSDLAAALCTPPAEAEHLKQRHGSALAALTPAEQTIEVPGLGGRAPHYLSRRALAEVIEPRAEEMLMLARAEIERAGCYQALASGVVWPAGGAGPAALPAFADRVFRLPVRLGARLHLNGLVAAVACPVYSTAVGLVLHGLRQQGHGRRGEGVLGQVGGGGERMMGWLREFF